MGGRPFCRTYKWFNPEDAMGSGQENDHAHSHTHEHVHTHSHPYSHTHSHERGGRTTITNTCPGGR
jgi:hypothetical protein